MTYLNGTLFVNGELLHRKCDLAPIVNSAMREDFRGNVSLEVLE